MNLAAAKWVMPLPCSRGGLDWGSKATLLALWSEAAWAVEASQVVPAHLVARARLAAATGQTIAAVRDQLAKLSALGWIRRVPCGVELAWMEPTEVRREEVEQSIRPATPTVRAVDGSDRHRSTVQADGPTVRPDSADGSSRRPSIQDQVLQVDQVSPPSALTLVHIIEVDPIAPVIARLLERQITALDAARKAHGIGRRFPAAGTKDRRAVESRIRERLVKDPRTEAECMHVLEVYAAEWLADDIALRKGWTTETPWRDQNFRQKLAAEVGAVRSTPTRRSKFQQACTPAEIAALDPREEAEADRIFGIGVERT